MSFRTGRRKDNSIYRYPINVSPQKYKEEDLNIVKMSPGYEWNPDLPYGWKHVYQSSFVVGEDNGFLAAIRNDNVGFARFGQTPEQRDRGVIFLEYLESGTRKGGRGGTTTFELLKKIAREDFGASKIEFDAIRESLPFWEKMGAVKRSDIWIPWEYEGKVDPGRDRIPMEYVL